MAAPRIRVCPPPVPTYAVGSCRAAPEWSSVVLPAAPASIARQCTAEVPEPAPRLILVAPAPTSRSCSQAPLPDVLCFDPAYESVEVTLTCDACYDGIDIIVPAGKFVSRVSQADADAQALAWGEEQLSCLPADPASFIPSWGDLTGDVAIARVDVYGAMGFEAAAFADSSRRMWCSFEPALDFCDGPDAEGVPTLEAGDRWSVRWRAEMTAGEFSYSKVGADLRPAPVELFPEPVSGAAGVSISFDANARPCFAFQVGGNVELRRFVAGSPTTYTWPGQGPKLFFNGLLQRDSELRDLVCYYVLGGKLCARIQRENFAVEHVLVDAPAIPGIGPLISVTKTDRGSGIDSSRNWLAATGVSGGFVLLRSGPYPNWPTLAHDYVTTSAGMSPDGDYSPLVIFADAADALTPLLAFLTDGDYQSITVVVGPADSATCTTAFSTDGDYFLVVVTAPNSSDALSGTAALASDGDYYETIVSRGSYTDTQTATAAFSTDGSYTR